MAILRDKTRRCGGKYLKIFNIYQNSTLDYNIVVTFYSHLIFVRRGNINEHYLQSQYFSFFE